MSDPEGRWLASAADHGCVRILDPVSQRLLHELDGHGDNVADLAAAPERGWLASADDAGRVCIWDSANGRLLHALAGHQGGVGALAVTPDGCWLASVGARQLAAKLAVAPSTLNRVLNGAAGVSPEMALRLSRALGRTPESWLALQCQHDLWVARQTVDLAAVEPVRFDAA